MSFLKEEKDVILSFITLLGVVYAVAVVASLTLLTWQLSKYQRTELVPIEVCHGSK